MAENARNGALLEDNANSSEASTEIRNYMEYCVEDMCGSILERLNVCTCDNCLMDIKAIALNSLPAKYVVTKKGQLYTKISSLQQQFDIDIIAAVTKAAIIVGRSPRHER